MKIIINTTTRDGVLDPQGKATTKALQDMGKSFVDEVKIGKQIVIETSLNDEAKAVAEAHEMAKELLVNELVENYTVEIVK